MNLPTPEALAEAVNETVQALHGFEASMIGECEHAVPLYSDAAPTIVIPLIGGPLLLIAVHASHSSGMAFASTLFNCDQADTNADMLEDALRELCNIVAGQVKEMIAPRHEIGLPSRLAEADTWQELRQASGVRLNVAQAQINIVVGEFPGFGA